MKLKISRSQKSKGVMSKDMIFCLDARVELTKQESDAVKKYHLGNQAVYNSARSKHHLDKGAQDVASKTLIGIIKGFFRLGMAKLALNITIDSLTKGQHIECKDMFELLESQDAIEKACEQTKQFIEIAETFDGQENIVEY